MVLAHPLTALTTGLFFSARKNVSTQSLAYAAMIRDIKQLPADFEPTYAAAFKNFQENMFDLVGNESAIFLIIAGQTYIALSNMLSPMVAILVSIAAIIEVALTAKLCR